MKIFGFDFRFNTSKLTEKASQVVNFLKSRFSNISSKLSKVDMREVEALFKEGVANAINDSEINYTPRMIDILEKWHVKELETGLTGKRTFEISHDFLMGKDKRYSVTIRGKEFRTSGKVILRSLEKGRRSYTIIPKNAKRLVWGYPTSRIGTSKHQRVAKHVIIPQRGIYTAGIGMIKAGKAKLTDYFRSKNISVTLKLAKMKGL